jgi:general secretion pathway protein G
MRPLTQTPLTLSTHRARCLRRARQRGFTLIEIIIVVAIIGSLMTALMMNYDKIFGESNEGIERMKVTQVIPGHLMRYNVKMRHYPTTEEGGLDALLKKLPNGQSILDEPDVLKDSWGNPYKYVYPGTHGGNKPYDLWSLGANGKDEAGAGDDIANWTVAGAPAAAN